MRMACRRHVPGDKRGGRLKRLTDAKQINVTRTGYDGGGTDIETIRTTLGISRATHYRYLKTLVIEHSPGARGLKRATESENRDNRTLRLTRIAA